MRDQKSLHWAFKRRPAAHARRCPWAHQVYRRVTAKFMAQAIWRQYLFMASPAKFRRLAAFTGKAINGPGIDEFTTALGNCFSNLCIAFSDMDHLHAKLMRQRRPIRAGFRHGHGMTRIMRDVQQRLLHEMRNKPRIGAMGHDRRGPRPILERKRAFPQRVIGAQ